MTAEEQAGRRITIAIAYLAGASPVILLCMAALAGREVPIVTWIVRGAIPVGLSWGLVQGRGWVRTLTVVGFAVGAIGALTRLTQANVTLSAILLESMGATIQGIAAIVLSMSPAVRAYFQFRNRPVTLHLTGA